MDNENTQKSQRKDEKGTHDHKLRDTVSKEQIGHPVTSVNDTHTQHRNQSLLQRMSTKTKRDQKTLEDEKD